MWYVFFHEDSWQCGWSVKDRSEAEKYCAEHPDYRFIYIG